jgi:hypothetical protein
MTSMETMACAREFGRQCSGMWRVGQRETVASVRSAREHSHGLWSPLDVLGLFSVSVGSWPLLVMWFDAAIRVYIDVIDALI